MIANLKSVRTVAWAVHKRCLLGFRVGRRTTNRASFGDMRAPSAAWQCRISKSVPFAGAFGIGALPLQLDVVVLGSHPLVCMMILAFVLRRNHPSIRATTYFALSSALPNWYAASTVLPEFFTASIEVWICVSVGIVALAFLGAKIRRIAEKRDLEQNRNDDEVLRFISNSSRMGILNYDLETATIQMNVQLRQMSGLDNELLSASEWTKLFHPDDRTGLIIQSQIVCDPTGASQQPLLRRLIRPDGSVRWVSVSSKMFCRGTGRARRVVRQVLTIQDVPPVVDDDGTRFDARRMEEIGRSTAGISHNFNNLLTVILTHAELAKKSTDVERISVSLQAIISASRIASRMTSQLVTFSKGTRLNSTLFDANGVVASICTMLSGSLGPKFSLSTDLSESPLPVLCDIGNFESCIINLILNARDAMGGGGTIAVKSEIRTQAGSANWIEISIADSGCGMDENTLARACEPFFTTKPDGIGSGLGLSTSHEFAILSGGDLKLSSEINVGTTARLSLPVGPEISDDKSGETGALHPNDFVAPTDGGCERIASTIQ